MSTAKEAGFDVNTPEGSASLGLTIKQITGKLSLKQMTNADLDKVLAALKQVKAVADAAGGGAVVG